MYERAKDDFFTALNNKIYRRCDNYRHIGKVTNVKILRDSHNSGNRT